MADFDTEAAVAKFKSDLTQHNTATVTHRNILGGGCYALDHDQYMSLKERVADHFRVATMEVIVVGSAKLGFSIAPMKRYRHFGDESDIDVAIASPKLFDAIWDESLDFHLDGPVVWDKLSQYRKNVFRGWIRPDQLPTHGSFQRSHEWFEFFRSLTQSGEYGQIKITGALYRTWRHLERYQWDAVLQCQEAEKGQTI